ncbi:S1C family serine protease [Variovorax sp. PBL-E5]|uniref:S1C family serine protease n=1 Tax=Variovorax sp. PBL-E5 TaxID=434014 RepID=UPI001316ADCC|nr:S1C family serine protease [Variovorax sp. PBL-E5]VTU33810.1 Putative serine protease HtrA [Variovorax sp. PBL-E5]
MSDTSFASPLAQLSAAMVDAVAAASRSVVAVHAGRVRASGFVWRDGLVVTCDEALPEDETVELVLPGGASVQAAVAGRDPGTDIALLRIEAAALVPVALDTAPAAQAGAIALAVGASNGSPLSAAGTVSLAGPAWRSLRGGDIDARIELDLMLRRSAEGGLVVDAGGRAFGMAVFGPRQRVLVIPAATIERVASLLATHGRVPRGYLGLALQPVKLNPSGVGAMVMNVAANGPAAAAGLRQGDVIVAWNGQPVRSIQMLLRALGPASVGTVLTLTLQRAGEPAEARLTVGERPAD